jgi:hypothetical protein
MYGNITYICKSTRMNQLNTMEQTRFDVRLSKDKKELIELAKTTGFKLPDGTIETTATVTAPAPIPATPEKTQTKANQEEKKPLTGAVPPKDASSPQRSSPPSATAPAPSPAPAPAPAPAGALTFQVSSLPTGGDSVEVGLLSLKVTLPAAK